jgi:hypothetical protein
MEIIMAADQENNTVIIDNSEILSKRAAERELKKIGAVSVPQYENHKLTAFHIYAKDGRMLTIQPDDDVKQPAITKSVIDFLKEPYQSQTNDYINAEDLGQDMAAMLSSNANNLHYTSDSVVLADDDGRMYSILCQKMHDAQNVPAYIVMTDNSGIGLAKIDPETIDIESIRQNVVNVYNEADKIAISCDGHVVDTLDGKEQTSYDGLSVATILYAVHEHDRKHERELQDLYKNGQQTHDACSTAHVIADIANTTYRLAGKSSQEYITVSRAEYNNNSLVLANKNKTVIASISETQDSNGSHIVLSASDREHKDVACEISKRDAEGHLVVDYQKAMSVFGNALDECHTVEKEIEVREQEEKVRAQRDKEQAEAAKREQEQKEKEQAQKEAEQKAQEEQAQREKESKKQEETKTREPEEKDASQDKSKSEKEQSDSDKETKDESIETVNIAGMAAYLNNLKQHYEETKHTAQVMDEQIEATKAKIAKHKIFGSKNLQKELQYYSDTKMACMHQMQLTEEAIEKQETLISKASGEHKATQHDIPKKFSLDKQIRIAEKEKETRAAQQKEISTPVRKGKELSD